MNIKLIRKISAASAILVCVVFAGCKISYTFSGASISPLAQTYSVAYFPNNAPMVAPTLSPDFTDALQDKFSRMTKLSNVRENGDLAFEGEIIGYMTSPSSISANEYAEQMRLTVTVRVRFTNAVEPQWNFEKTFSQYADYPSTQMLQEVESSILPDIIDMLVDDIFNAAVSNW